MDERTYMAFRQFKRRGAAYIAIPALITALVVSIGISWVFLQTFGKTTAAGLNGVVAGSMSSASALENPTALRELEDDMSALVRLSPFVFLEVQSADGRRLAVTGDSECVEESLDHRERETLRSGRTFTYIGKCGAGDYTVMVVSPLTRAIGEAPYGVIRSHRSLEFIVPFLALTALTLFVVILTGAFTAAFLLRRLVTRTEDALDEDQRIINALDRRLKHSLRELEEHSVGTLQALVAAVDARDTYTAHHSLNVSDYACAIARQMGLEDELSVLERAGLLHDIGKIGIAEHTLLKPGRLTAEEYASVKEHSEIGAGIIEMAPFLQEVVPIVRHHHECWDGSGYPAGLAGEEIPLLARILGVADALDAMTTDRAYRSALSVARARMELVAGRGSQFDPVIVDATVELIDARMIRIPRRLEFVTA